TCPNGCEDLGDTARCILNCTDIASAVGTPATTGDLTGAPAVSDLPCFAGNPPSGPEVCFLWTAPTTGSYMFDTLNSSPVDDTVLGVYDAAGTLLGCNDDEANSYLSVTGAPTVAGAEYTIVVDSWPGQTGAFNLNINELLPESACDDMADNDMDNYIDCADDTACAGTASCTPGAGILAAACTVPSDCASNAGADPFCFPDAWGFTNGNCSEWCDIAAQDCAAGGVCAQLYMGGVPLAEGLCLIACDGGTVCPTGLTCDLEYGFCFL
ncbi:MAG TPA: hypothetical protein P5076_25140, partial [Myxococcota bacterium]|nr:hypothetical protein [Myxococcota bacterium]